MFSRLRAVPTVRGLIKASLFWSKPPYKIVEIGVFKGDNAAALIRFVQKHGSDVQYVGFDLFEDKDAFFNGHPDDRQWYDHPDYPYWEFGSGEHALAQVKQKLMSVLEEEQFVLVPGDSTKTVPESLDLLRDAHIIFVDGCHDYDIVRQDWMNIRELMVHNPTLVVAFDDYTYPGVAQLRMELESSDPDVQVLALNFNQFFVISGDMPRTQRAMLQAVALFGRVFGRAPE